MTGSTDTTSEEKDPGDGGRAGEDATRHHPGPSPVVVNQGRLLALLVAGWFLTATQMSGLAPLLVDLADEFHTSVGAMGQLAAASALPWAILAPFMGVLSDRFGRRPVLGVGTALLGLSTLLSALAWSYPSLFAFRMIGGIAGATTGPNLMSSVGDFFPPNRQGRALGLGYAGLSLATVIGVPLVAAVAAFVGWRWAFAGLALTLVLLGAAVWMVFPRSRQSGPRTGFISGFASALAVRSTPLLLAANVLEKASFLAVTIYVPAFIMQSYSLHLEQVAPLLSAIAAGAVLGSVLGGRLADRGRRVLVYSSFQVVAAALALPLFATAPGIIPTALLAASFGISNALARPAWLWLIAQVPGRLRGTTMGFVATTNQAGFALGGAVGGILIGLGSYSYLGILAAAAALASAIICPIGASRMRSK